MSMNAMYTPAQGPTSYKTDSWAVAPPPSSQPIDGDANTHAAGPLMVAAFMFVIAFQLWRGKPNSGCHITRTLIIAYTLAMGVFEATRAALVIEPDVLQILGFTHTVWEWAIVGYMFFDSKSTSTPRSWLLSRLWIWLISKAVALIMAVPTQSMEGLHIAPGTLADSWTGHVLIAVILYRAITSVRTWAVEAMIMQEVMLPFSGQTQYVRSCRLSHPNRSWLSRLIS